MSLITDLYTQLFGKEHIRDGDVIDMSEHGRVGGISTGQAFKHVSVVDSYTGDEVTQVATGIEGGPITVGTTPVALSFSNTPISLMIQMNENWVGHAGTPVYCYIGYSNVLSDGSNAIVKLGSGEIFSIDYNDIDNQLYVVCSAADQEIWLTAATR